MIGSTRGPVRGGLAATLVAVACGACGGGSTSSLPAPTACTPVEPALEAGASLAGAAGAWRLAMIAGDDTARSSTGVVRFVARTATDPRMGDYRTPLQGTAEIALEQVGALRVGSLASEDEAAPGVLVLEQAGTPPTIFVRFGSTANRTDRVAFDEAYTVLRVHALDGERFAGSWRSGARGSEVTGYFCAERD